MEVMGIPTLITREHILRGIEETAEFGVPEGRRSRDYCLVFEGKHYPPKYVISQAAKYAIGRELEPSEFSGGEDPGCANHFLKSKGFHIIDCKCGGGEYLEKMTKAELVTTINLPEEQSHNGCCATLFGEYEFQDLVRAEPPREKGVYVIRIKNRSDSLPEAMIREAKQLIAKVGWKMLEKKMVSRIERLRRIGACPTIYIGSAGTQHGSRNTLKGRYKEFSGRHTAMYPIWVLLYFGWKLEFGWKTCTQPSLEEKKLEEHYQRIHQRRLPPLVER